MEWKKATPRCKERGNWSRKTRLKTVVSKNTPESGIFLKIGRTESKNKKKRFALPAQHIERAAVKNLNRQSGRDGREGMMGRCTSRRTLPAKKNQKAQWVEDMDRITMKKVCKSEKKVRRARDNDKVADYWGKKVHTKRLG